MKKYIDTDEAKILKDLKWTLSKMYKSVAKALYDTNTKETDKEYLRGCQDCINTIMWIIYKGEHDEN